MKKPELHCADALIALSFFEDNSIDSLVTDPPAGISFMGKSWDDDKGGRKQWIDWMTEVMQECLRVMKPGACGLVWALPRTSHWTATALEDAGFEIRDVITHHFGSGFPKSMNISIAIDKQAGAMKHRGKAFVTAGAGEREDIQSTSGWEKDPGHNPITNEAKQWQGYGTALKPASEHWILVRKKGNIDACEEIVLSVIPNTQLTMLGLKKAQDLLAHTLADLNVPPEEKEKTLLLGRVVNGLDTTAMSLLVSLVKTIDLNIVSSWKNISAEDLEKVKTFTTLMASRQTTELKILNCSQLESTRLDTNSISPETEHVILVRKPISEKTVAANVLKWGVGGLNIDESRIVGVPWKSHTATGLGSVKFFTEGDTKEIEKHPHNQGRFPANLILSHSDNCTEEACDMFDCPIHLMDEQSGILASGHNPKRGNKGIFGEADNYNGDNFRYKSGGASRFFYCAKAPTKDKGENNTHPTVKNTKLMQYLIKLVTPKNGIVLDPFMGSGSTGVAALKDGFKFVGIEKEKEYFEISKVRIANGV